MNITELKDSVLAGYIPSFEEGLALSEVNDKALLYSSANEIREHFCGDFMELCSITNAKSGSCPQDCKWCSQSKFAKSKIDTYDMIGPDQALKEALYNAKKGVNRMSLVTSGRRISDKDLEKGLKLYDQIRSKTDMGLCASMGLMTKGQLMKLKEHGVTTYHCNLETSPSYFPNVVSTHTQEEKIRSIKWAQEVGLSICSGGIIGMGETMRDRIELAFELQKLNVPSIPINILNPQEGTELGHKEALSEDEVLTTMAVFRFMNPKASVRFAGGRILIQDYQEKALKVGMNSAIVGDLLTTVGPSIDEDKVNFQKAGFKLKGS